MFFNKKSYLVLKSKMKGKDEIIFQQPNNMSIDEFYKICNENFSPIPNLYEWYYILNTKNNKIVKDYLE